MRRSKVWLLILVIVIASAPAAHAGRCQNRGRGFDGERRILTDLCDSG